MSPKYDYVSRFLARSLFIDGIRIILRYHNKTKIDKKILMRSSVINGEIYFPKMELENFMIVIMTITFMSHFTNAILITVSSILMINAKYS